MENDMGQNQCGVPLTIRKPGVLETTEAFPVCDVKLTHLKATLLDTVVNEKLPKARVCFMNEAAQDMLLCCRRDSLIQPHFQHHKTVSYEMIEGTSRVVLFDDSGDVLELIALNEGQLVTLPSDIPRTTLYDSEFVYFREQLTGTFSDSDTVWPFQQVFSKESIEALLKEKKLS